MADSVPVPVRFRPVIERIVERLAAGDFDGLARDYSPYADEPGFDLGIWARKYPATFVPLPFSWWEHVDAYVRDDGSYGIDLDLWSEEEGISDMTLTMVIRDRHGGVDVEIRNLRTQ